MSIDVNRYIYFALRIKSDYLARGIDVTISRKQQNINPKVELYRILQSDFRLVIEKVLIIDKYIYIHTYSFKYSTTYFTSRRPYVNI